MISLGQKIRDLRVRKGLTQQELGSGIVTISMISQIESDKAYPSHKVLEQIATRLETPIEYFVADMQTQMEQSSTFKMAKAYLSASDFERAIPLFRELIANPAPHLPVHEVQYDLADAFLASGEVEKSVELFEQVLDTVVRKNDDYAALLCLNKLGEARFSQENYLLALYHWHKAYETFSRVKEIDPFTRARIITNLGQVQQHLGEYEESIRFYREAYNLLRGSTNMRQLADVYLGLGNSYKNLGDFARAIDYCHDALTIYESLQNVKQAIDVKANFAMVEADQGRFDEAVEMLHECLAEYRKHELPVDNARIHGEIAHLYVRSGKLQQAEAFCQESLFLLPDSTENLAVIFQSLAVVKRAQGDLDAAIEWIKRAIELYEKHQQYSELRSAFQELAELHEAMGNYMLANETLRQLQAIFDTSLRRIGILV
ncbi:MAG: tetratricopeptide repeat protein [Tumebacillaceae bacterium]